MIFFIAQLIISYQTCIIYARVAYQPVATVLSSSSVLLGELSSAYTFSEFNRDSGSELISVRGDSAGAVSLSSAEAVNAGSTAGAVDISGVSEL